MLYQMTRDVISPASQEVVVDAGEILTADAIQALNDELGIDHVQCEVWLAWTTGEYPAVVRDGIHINGEDIKDRAVIDLSFI